jgi:hypothetical protein
VLITFRLPQDIGKAHGRTDGYDKLFVGERDQKGAEDGHRPVEQVYGAGESPRRKEGEGTGKGAEDQSSKEEDETNVPAAHDGVDRDDENHQAEEEEHWRLSCDY